MFQYAALRAFGLRHNIPIFYPSKFPPAPDLHAFFNILQSDFIDGEYDSHVEPYFQYKEIPLLSSNMILFGYYQSEKYFKDAEETIRKEFTFRHPKITENVDAISLHVRRGDYLNLVDDHPVCPVTYYTKALELLPDKNVIVFSDDIEWCKKTFKGSKFQFSEGRSPSEDIEYMSRCSHHVIANSSFSWWGAWLGHNENKIVIAPKRWFGKNKEYDTKDLYCSGWHII
tara:strand:- start:1345 stop:2028 length:684 start_codon:yes stop_codon:yes gene_type:complete